MVIVISGGGTAGHIYPAIAVGKELQRRGHTVYFAGTPTGLEATLAPDAGFDFTPFAVAGFNRSHPTTLVTSAFKALKGSARAKKWLGGIGAQAVVGFGGYVSVPVGKAASDLGIPLVIHEQNSACGMANKYMAPHASAIAITYEAARAALVASKATCPIVVTGNPVRAQMMGVDARAARSMLRVPDGARLLFVFGGSLGAQHINTAIVALAPALLEDKNLHVLHVAGKRGYDETLDALTRAGIEVAGPVFREDSGWSNPGSRYVLTDYFEHMAQGLAASDVVVSRAGATSLAEITAVGAVALLVPYPHATDDHQTKNAQALVEAGAALMCPDDQLGQPGFEQQLLGLLQDAGARQRMRALARQLGRTDAAARVADIVEQAARGA